MTSLILHFFAIQIHFDPYFSHEIKIKIMSDDDDCSRGKTTTNRNMRSRPARHICEINSVLNDVANQNSIRRADSKKDKQTKKNKNNNKIIYMPSLKCVHVLCVR